MSIFNTNKKPTTIPVVESFDTEISSYNLLSDMEADGYKISLEFNQSTYIGMKENSAEILEEGFKEFVDKVVKFFKDLIKKILEFFNNSMKFFLSFFQDFSKFLEKNKEHLRKLNPSFSFKGFEYKFPNAPILTSVKDIVNSYNIEIHNVDSITNAEVIKMRDEFANEHTKNKIRASILGLNGEISQDNFHEECKKLFRTSKDEININVNKSYVNKIIEEYPKLKKSLDETKENKDKIVKLLTDLEVFFQRKASVIYENTERKIKTNTLNADDDKLSDGDEITSNFDDKRLKTLNLYFDHKYNESKFISNCIITVYLDKINAIRDCMKQYKAVTREVLFKDHGVKDSNTESKK